MRHPRALVAAAAAVLIAAGIVYVSGILNQGPRLVAPSDAPGTVIGSERTVAEDYSVGVPLCLESVGRVRIVGAQSRDAAVRVTGMSSGDGVPAGSVVVTNACADDDPPGTARARAESEGPHLQLMLRGIPTPSAEPVQVRLTYTDDDGEHSRALDVPVA